MQVRFFLPDFRERQVPPEHLLVMKKVEGDTDEHFAVGSAYIKENNLDGNTNDRVLEEIGDCWLARSDLDYGHYDENVWYIAHAGDERNKFFIDPQDHSPALSQENSAHAPAASSPSSSSDGRRSGPSSPDRKRPRQR